MVFIANGGRRDGLFVLERSETMVDRSTSRPIRVDGFRTAKAITVCTGPTDKAVASLYTPRTAAFSAFYVISAIDSTFSCGYSNVTRITHVEIRDKRNSTS